jgi:serine/threonine protein kinase
MVPAMPNTSKGPSLTREAFVQNLFDSGLFSPDDVSRSLAGLLDDASLADADALARRLQEAGKLTAYQADSVRQRQFTELLIGNYEVLDRLGAGGMGTVYKARHRRMKRIVALKVLSRAASESETFLQRFQREVEVIARLSHPNIVMAFDADEADVGHFLVMEFVNGRDLASEVADHGPLAVPAAVAALLQAARALEYAHAQGIIHRDIKPANLLRDADGTIKVADLGLARVHEPLAPRADSGITQAGTVVGTVDYMSPEQAFDSAHLDGRADVYSLGCTLYFLLTGRPPYQGASFMAILLQHREAPLPSLGAARPDVPTVLEAVFRKMAAKKPEDRYQTMTEVVHALERLAPAPPAPPASTRPNTASPPSSNTAEFIPSQTTQSEMAPRADAGATVILPGPARREEGDKGREPGILLVEPSRTQANIIRSFLTQLGTADVLVVPSGQKALEALHQARPQTVLCAMHLSDITGVELVRKVRAEPRFADVSFILISSEPDALQAGGLADGRTVLLAKPFDLEGLAQALRRAAAPGPGAGR